MRSRRDCSPSSSRCSIRSAGTGCRSPSATGTRSAFSPTLGLLLAFGLVAGGRPLLVRLFAAAASVPLALTLLLHFQPRRLDCARDRVVWRRLRSIRAGSGSRCRSGPSHPGQRSRSSSHRDPAPSRRARTHACRSCARTVVTWRYSPSGLRCWLRGRPHCSPRSSRASGSRPGVVGSATASSSPGSSLSPRCARRSRRAVCDRPVLRGTSRVERRRPERAPVQPVRETGALTSGALRGIDAAENPVLGSGAGSFKRYWLEHRPERRLDPGRAQAVHRDARGARARRARSGARRFRLPARPRRSYAPQALGSRSRQRRSSLTSHMQASTGTGRFPVLTLVALAAAGVIVAEAVARLPNPLSGVALRFSRWLRCWCP